MVEQTRGRTLAVLLTLFALLTVNTVLGSVVQRYSPWFAWVVFGSGIIAMALVLWLQQRISMAIAVLLLAIPFVIAVIGAIVGV